jgi:uncharacterized protein YndB with AHSA1/START domain
LSEKLDGHAYALYSDAALRSMGVDPAAQGLIAHHETIDIIGDVKLWARDLETAWDHDDAQARIEVTRAEAHAILEFDIAAPRQAVWEHLTVPGQWRKWWVADDIVEHSNKGRRGVGTRNHCMHGKGATIEETLDWRPVDYFTVGITLPVPDAPRIVLTRALLERPDGTTHLELRVAKPKPKDKAFVDHAAAIFTENMTKTIIGLQSLAEGKEAAVGALEEPALTSPAGRFLTEPVKSGAPR